jgi:hypothetical protein
MILIFASEAGLIITPVYSAVLEEYDPIPPQLFRM